MKPMKLSSLTTQDKIKLAAELDGWQDIQQGNPATGKPTVGRSPDAVRRCADYTLELPNYSTSYDAIIPLVQKQPKDIYEKFVDILVYSEVCPALKLYGDSPSQLLDALLVATGKAEL